MAWKPDPTFYPSPRSAIEAPREELAYVAILNTGVDILVSGVAAGTIAYGAHWWRERA